MNKHWDKFLENMTSIKFWGSLIATGLLMFGLITEITWASIFGGLLGLGRIAEYFASRKNGVANGGK